MVRFWRSAWDSRLLSPVSIATTLRLGAEWQQEIFRWLDGTPLRKWLISYVLYSPGDMDFVNALTSAGATRIMAFHWVLESEKSAIELRDDFAALLSPSDQLLVAELGQEVVWGAKQ
jgi:hypothetical protein